MSAYFSYFPTQFYSNNVTTNIIAKVKFNESVAKNLAVFYSYTIKEGERPDQVAESYYEDSSYDWVVYLSNGIIDPYFDWPKAHQEFDDFLRVKYGTMANAQIQTAFWRVNYESDDSVISTAAYDALAPEQKKYWSPIVGYNETVMNYERKKIDLISETNRIISLQGTFDVPVDSVIKQSGTTRGTVKFANTTTLMISHVSGTWSAGDPVLFSIDNTVANATITSVSTVVESIPPTELVYWEPVTYYEHEIQLNENRKHIQLVSAVYLNQIERDMKELLQA